LFSSAGEGLQPVPHANNSCGNKHYLGMSVNIFCTLTHPQPNPSYLKGKPPHVKAKPAYFQGGYPHLVSFDSRAQSSVVEAFVYPLPTSKMSWLR
ncbi:MAG: hypothetical protein KA198_06925, partial [Chitinophagaceae bacterium]|nr:hypothetical protein [Chitinophagaceae bacterium]